MFICLYLMWVSEVARHQIVIILVGSPTHGTTALVFLGVSSQILLTLSLL